MSSVKPLNRVVGGKYEIERRLAVGGMGELFVAVHVFTTQRVALKVLDPRLARDTACIERFLREVRFAAKIGHPGIVKVFDAGIDASADGEPEAFLAMELLEGCTLAQRLATGTVTQRFALDCLVEVLDPLAAAHAQGVVHRDLKPENVFLEGATDGSDRVKLLDFGIARELQGDAHATNAGQGLGTVYYMAPEQAVDARHVTPASDVWSVGVMLYQVLTGTLPFEGETPAAVVIRTYNEPHAPLAAACPDLDRRLADLVERCLSKSPDGRPRDAAALRDELAPLAQDPAVRATLASHYVSAYTFLPGDPLAAPPDRPAPAPRLSAPVIAPAPVVREAPAAAPAASRSLRAVAVAALAIPLALAGAWGLHARLHTAPTPVAARALVAAPSRAPAPLARPPVAVVPAPVAVVPAPVAVVPTPVAVMRPPVAVVRPPTAFARPSTQGTVAPDASRAASPVVAQEPSLPTLLPEPPPPALIPAPAPTLAPAVVVAPTARPAAPAVPAPPPQPSFVTF